MAFLHNLKISLCLLSSACSLSLVVREPVLSIGVCFISHRFICFIREVLLLFGPGHRS